MPTFICEQNFQLCINETVGVAASQAVCNQNEKANCGHTDPSSFEAVVSSSSAASTPTSSGASGATVASTSSTPTSTSSKAAAATMLAIGGEYAGAGLVAAGVAAAFGLLL